MDLTSRFSLPLLIYDDKCSSCTKFARAIRLLSLGRIRIAGHYYSTEAIEAKKIVFPTTYDPTKMFWLINKKGAYGARLGLIQVIKEIIIGWFKGGNRKKNQTNKKKDSNDNQLSCIYDKSALSCDSPESILIRIINLMRNGKKFQF